MYKGMLSMCKGLWVMMGLMIFQVSFGRTINVEKVNYIDKKELINRLNDLPSEVSIKYSKEIHNIINEYIYQYRQGSEEILGRFKQFYPLFQYNNDQYTSLPDDVKYLAIIESGLKLDAISKSGAVGLWQFMKKTAQYYGLTINNEIDERMDPYLSTNAAMEYLTYLYDEFDNWTLALASYNCGPGTVRRAIRKNNVEEYWELRETLPKETRRYIPKFIAATYLVNHYGNHNLTPKSGNTSYPNIAIARIYDYTTLAEVAEELHLSLEEVQDLNPALMKGYLPATNKGHLLTLPDRKMYEYLIKRDKLGQLVYAQSKTNEVIEQLVIDWGFRRFISSEEVLGSLYPRVTSIENYEYTSLKYNESLVDLVARLSNTTLEELFELNNFNKANPPIPGQKIKIGRKP